jgi:hypothetical protein
LEQIGTQLVWHRPQWCAGGFTQRRTSFLPGEHGIMSLTLNTRGYVVGNTSRAPVDDPLKYELGWKDVASALGRILLGYLLLLACAILGVLLIVYVGLQVLMRNPNNGHDLAALWTLLGGLGVMGLLGMGSYGLILTGKLQCALHAPDRFGCRWFMFACLTCMVFGPVLNIAISIGGQPANAELKKLQRNPSRQVSLPMPVLVTNVVGSVVSYAATILFVLFLRSVGKCFQNSVLTSLSELYLLAEAVLLAGTLYLVLSGLLFRMGIVVGLGLGVGWFVLACWYFGLLLLARTAILTGVANLKSSLLAN